MDESIAAEHARLLEQMKALEDEHAALEANPNDVEGHERHRDHLRKQIDELRSHITRIRQSRRPDDER